MGGNGVNISDYWTPAKMFPSLGDLTSHFLPKALLLAGVILFIMALVAGLGIIAGAGSGDAHAAENRQKVLTYAILGIVIIFGAYWILQIINYITRGALDAIL